MTNRGHVTTTTDSQEREKVEPWKPNINKLYYHSADEENFMIREVEHEEINLKHIDRMRMIIKSDDSTTFRNSLIHGTSNGLGLVEKVNKVTRSSLKTRISPGTRFYDGGHYDENRYSEFGYGNIGIPERMSVYGVGQTGPHDVGSINKKISQGNSSVDLTLNMDCNSATNIPNKSPFASYGYWGGSFINQQRPVTTPYDITGTKIIREKTLCTTFHD